MALVALPAALAWQCVLRIGVINRPHTMGLLETLPRWAKVWS